MVETSGLSKFSYALREKMFREKEQPLRETLEGLGEPA
jgi:hypothetical protein